MDITEAVEMLVALEPVATALAARSMTTAAWRELAAILADMNAAFLAGDLMRYVNELDPAFHRRIYTSSLRPNLARMVDAMRGDVAWACASFLTSASTPSAPFTAAQQDCEQILAALRARHAEAAAQIMQRHIERAARHVLLAFPDLGHDSCAGT